MQNKLLKKFLSFSYGNVIGMIIGFITTPILTRILLPEEFGIVSLVTLVINLVMLFSVFSTDQSFVRFFYEEDENGRRRLLYECLKISIYIFLPLLVILVLYREKLSFWIFNKWDINLFIFIIMGIIFSLFNRFSSLVIRMQQKGALYSNLEIANKTLNLLFIVVFFFLFKKGYIIPIYALVLSMGIVTIISIYKEKEFWKFSLNKKYTMKNTKITIIKFAYPLVGAFLLNWLFQAFDRIAIKQWSTLTDLGIYSAAFKVVGILAIIQSSFATFWTPICYEHYEKKPEDKEFYSRMSIIVQFFMLCIGIFTVLFKGIFILVLGEIFRDAFYIIPFLVMVPIFHTISETTFMGIGFAKKSKVYIWISLGACFTNIVMNMILVPKLGALGAGISTSLGYFVFFLLRTYLGLKFYKVDFKLKRFYIFVFLMYVNAIIPFVFRNNIMMYAIGLSIFGLLTLAYWKDLMNSMKGRVYK